MKRLIQSVAVLALLIAWSPASRTEAVMQTGAAAAAPHQAMLTTYCHFGGIIVPPGYTDQSKFDDGNPYGVSVVADADGLDDTARTALDHLVTRVLDMAARLDS